MRIYIILFLAMLVSACNGSSTDNDPSVPADNDSSYATQAQLTQQIASLQAKLDTLQKSIAPNESTQVQALQAEVHKLQIIGQPFAHATATDGVHTLAMLREPVVAAPSSTTSSGQFGPCTDMGVLLGRGNNLSSTDPLTTGIESFQTCTGYEYSVEIGSSSIAIAPRIFFDGPNCTGNMMEWQASGASYNTQTLNGGVVFINPVDGTTVLMIASSQTPQARLIQSVWVSSNPGCQSDVETHEMYAVTPNDVSVTGVSGTVPGTFQLTSP